MTCFTFDRVKISTKMLTTKILIEKEIWGSGVPYREFLFSDDLASACLYLMGNKDVGEIGELVNIGSGEDLKIKDLAEIIKKVVGFEGEIDWDKTKPDGTPRKLLDVVEN